MKIKLLMLTLICNTLTNAQDNMSELYSYVINDIYSDYCERDYFLQHDTLYFTFNFCDCGEKCFGYDIQLKNDRIQFAVPDVNEYDCCYPLKCLFAPRIIGRDLEISVGNFSVFYDKETEETFIECNDTTVYRFKYKAKKKKYVFYSKKEYGI